MKFCIKFEMTCEFKKSIPSEAGDSPAGKKGIGSRAGKWVTSLAPAIVWAVIESYVAEILDWIAGIF